MPIAFDGHPSSKLIVLLSTVMPDDGVFNGLIYNDRAAVAKKDIDGLMRENKRGL